MEYSSTLIIKDILIAIAAVIGMVFGFLNYWNERYKEKIRLKVVPKSVKGLGRNSEGREFFTTSINEFDMETSNGLFAVEVINLSKFSVTIDEVGFLARGHNNRLTILNPILGDNGDWPRKLEPRDVVTVYGDIKTMLSSPLLPSVYCAFADTACGHQEIGSSNALLELTVEKN